MGKSQDIEEMRAQIMYSNPSGRKIDRPTTTPRHTEEEIAAIIDRPWGGSSRRRQPDLSALLQHPNDVSSRTPPTLKREDCSSWSAEKSTTGPAGSNNGESDVLGSILVKRPSHEKRKSPKKVRFADEEPDNRDEAMREIARDTVQKLDALVRDKYGEPFDANLFSRYTKEVSTSGIPSSDEEDDEEMMRRLRKRQQQHSRHSPEAQEGRHREGKVHARPGTPESPLAYKSSSQSRYKHRKHSHSFSPSSSLAPAFPPPPRSIPTVPNPPTPISDPWSPTAPRTSPSPELNNAPRLRPRPRGPERQLSLSPGLRALAASSPDGLQPPTPPRDTDVSSMVVEVESDGEERRRRRRHGHHGHHRRRRHEDHGGHSDSRSPSRSHASDHHGSHSHHHHSRSESREGHNGSRREREGRWADEERSPQEGGRFNLSGLFFRERYAEPNIRVGQW
ncbi:hypothetical protein GGS26DRAFT_598263 [Hypomontagnella submonticulosa]|nr:hypothetical protein GGS26DRAFT_598263 [Hypomontagnella submonticulosa]